MNKHINNALLALSRASEKTARGFDELALLLSDWAYRRINLAGLRAGSKKTIKR